MSVLEGGSAQLAMILEANDIAHARVALEVADALPKRPEQIFHGLLAAFGKEKLMVGAFNDHLMRAHSIHAVIKALSHPVEITFHTQGGNLLGTTRRLQPAVFAEPPLGRNAMISGGVLASLPEQRTKAACWSRDWNAHEVAGPSGALYGYD